MSACVSCRRCTERDVIRLGESEYDLASTGNVSGEKTTATQLVRRCISDELRNVLGDNDENLYIAPVSESSAAPPQLPSPRIHDIGYNTLTRVIREELRQFRADVRHSQSQLPTSDVLQSSSSSYNNASRSGTGMGDYEEIGDIIRVISERDRVRDGGDDGEVDDEPQQAPPPPPLRLGASSPASPSTYHAVDVSRHQPPHNDELSLKITGNGVRQRKALMDNQKVIRLLERIEKSTAELDASFTALINVGLQRPGDWQRLARQLPICRPAKVARHIAKIEARYRDDAKQQAAAALAEWRSYRRNKATLGELKEALKRCDLLEEVHFLDNMAKESAT